MNNAGRGVTLKYNLLVKWFLNSALDQELFGEYWLSFNGFISA